MALQQLTEADYKAALEALEAFKKSGIKSSRFDPEIGKDNKVISWQFDSVTDEWVSK